MSDNNNVHGKFAFMEIDVIGYTSGFNRAAKQARKQTVMDTDIKYAVREINIAHIKCIDQHLAGENPGSFRSASSRITMIDGEVIHSPRSEAELKALRVQAIQSPDLSATIFAQRPESPPDRFSKASDLILNEGFKEAGDYLGGAKKLQRVLPQNMEVEYAGPAQ